MSSEAPIDESITIQQLTHDPYPIYKRLRAEQPVLQVKSVGRTFLTRATDTKYVKDNPELFSSDDPDTPMKRAFKAHTLMRKDGREHRRERMAMALSLAPRTIRSVWAPMYTGFAEEYIDRLPRGEKVDLFSALCGPLAGRILAEMMGIPQATDEEMQRWSQVLIDGAGNFGWRDELFESSDNANDEMDAAIQSRVEKLKAEPDSSALSVMINAEDPIPMSQIIPNIKIAIGGGINEPRDALATVVYGLLTNPDQLEQVKKDNLWKDAFEEGVRWVAPIQVSSRRVTEDTEIRGLAIPAGDTVMTIQGSANRDEDVVKNGENFDMFNNDFKQHQSFGNGPHHCAGFHSARALVGEISLPMLFDRFPNMELVKDEKVNWSGFGFRGPINMPVVLN